MKRVLIVEDDRDIADLVALHLESLPVQSRCVEDGLQAAALLEEQPFDLVILDLMLPGLDGLEVCRRLRRCSPSTFVLMLTAKATEVDRVVGLEVGADDYLTKPFSVLELVARVKAAFRRIDGFESSPQAEVEALSIGDLSIDRTRRLVTVGDRKLDLTAKEFELLFFFARHPGHVFTRSQLLDKVWGYGHDGYEHTVNSHINRLRSKVEPDPGQPRYIQTVWGVGYRFAEEVAA